MECDFNFQYHCILGHLTLKENPSMRNGLMSDRFVDQCSSWSQATALKTSSSVTNQRQSFDVNRRAVYHSLETGGGYDRPGAFCSIMNIPCIPPVAYYKLVDTILLAQEADQQRQGNNGKESSRRELAAKRSFPKPRE